MANIAGLQSSQNMTIYADEPSPNSNTQTIYYIVPKDEAKGYWWQKPKGLTVQTDNNGNVIGVQDQNVPTLTTVSSPQTGESDQVVALTGTLTRCPSNDDHAYATLEYRAGNQQVDYGRSTYRTYGRELSEADNETCLCICEGGTGTVSSVPYERLEPNLSSDSNVILINSDANANINVSTTGIVADDIALETGADRTNRVYMGHSASGPITANSAYNYLKSEHSQGRDTKTTLVLNDSMNAHVCSSENQAKEFDDSLVVATIPSNAQAGYSTYKQDLERMGNNGANVMVVKFDGDFAHDHENSNNVSAQLGFCDPAHATLTDQVTFNTPSGETTRNVTYSCYDADTRSWVDFKSASEAQVFLDTSVGKEQLYNGGYLHKEDGTYVLGNNTVITDTALDSLAYDFKTSGLTFDEFMEQNAENIVTDENGNITGYIYTPRGSDGEDHSEDKVNRTVDNLSKYISDYTDKISSLKTYRDGSFKINSDTACSKDKGTFPGGIAGSLSALSAQLDCLDGKSAENLDAAYGRASAVQAAIKDANDNAPSFGGNNYTNQTPSNFAEDLRGGK